MSGLIWQRMTKRKESLLSNKIAFVKGIHSIEFIDYYEWFHFRTDALFLGLENNASGSFCTSIDVHVRLKMLSSKLYLSHRKAQNI